MKHRILAASVLALALPAPALAHGQDLVFDWFWSEAALLAMSVVFMFFVGRGWKAKLLLSAAILVIAGGTNALLFLPGSMAFMSELGSFGIFLLFGALPVAAVGGVYRLIRSGVKT